MTSDRNRRLRAALFGLALGDALGAPFEGRSRIARDEIDAWRHADAPLRWTDDTAMALVLARQLRDARGSLDQQQLGDAFATAHAAEPWRGYGSGPPQVFSLARRGMPYVEAARSLFGGAGSFGNGAAMRVVPVSLVAAGDPVRATALAIQQSQVTHTHVEALDGAVFMAATSCLLANVPAGRTDVREAMHGACRLLTGDTVRAEIRAVLDLDARGGDLVADARARGTGVAARESVPAAVTALLTGRDPTSTWIAAIELGGDTDTIAAMAGALAGALHGEDALSPELMARLEARHEIGDLADALLHPSTSPGGG